MGCFDRNRTLSTGQTRTLSTGETRVIDFTEVCVTLDDFSFLSKVATPGYMTVTLEDIAFLGVVATPAYMTVTLDGFTLSASIAGVFGPRTLVEFFGKTPNAVFSGGVPKDEYFGKRPKTVFSGDIT